MRNKQKSEASIRYQIVEIEKGSSEPITEEVSNAIAALEHNPGFEALVSKLRLRRAALETKLKTANHADIRDVDKLQAGIFWSNWLETEVKSEIKRREIRPALRDAYEHEQKEFERMREALSIIGADGKIV